MEKIIMSKLNDRIIEELSPIDTEEEYDNFLDECYEPCCVENFEFDPSRVLSELDPIAYRCGMSDWLDSASEQYYKLDGEYYHQFAVDNLKEEIKEAEQINQREK